MTQSKRDASDDPDRNAGSGYRNVALRAIEARDMERAALSRFLHDDIAQFLSGIGLQLDILKLDLEARVPEIGTRTAEIQEILEQVVTRIRDLSSDLNPKIVERAGLKNALDLLAGRYRRIFRGRIRMLFDCQHAVAPPVAELFYRIAEHAVDNAVSHSGGDLVEILFRETTRGPVLEVRDDGRGFDCNRTLEIGGESGLGFAIMQYYAARGGIRLKISSKPGKGTVISASLSRTPVTARDGN
jgi:signal transduction histidine kinase